MLSIWMLVAATTALSSGADSGATWHADYGDALAETKQDGQPLLIVLDNPSKAADRLDPSLLNAEKGSFPLDRYALCHVDVTTKYGKQVAEGFKVTEFPHVAIIDKSGTVILRRVKGEVTEQEWTKILNKHADGLRVGATAHTVSKPVISTPVSTYTPSISAPISYPAPVAQPYCPSCQLRNR